MRPYPLDDDLAAGLGPETAEWLATWAANMRKRYRLHRWLDGGLSGARVCAVDEIGDDDAGFQRLILKVDELRDTSDGLAEYGRHADAVKHSEAYAAAHLTALEYTPINVGHRRLALFQRIVGGDLEEYVLLAGLFEGGRAGGGQRQAELFVDACETIVRSVLADWAGKPKTLSDEACKRWNAGKNGEISIRAFLDLSLDRWGSTARIDEKAKAFPGNYITADREPRKLPSPFAVRRGTAPLFEDDFRPIVGKGHGDLHLKNVLLPIDLDRPGEPDAAAYRLVDLAKYQPELPLTDDPVYLVLYVIARTMPDLSDSQQDALILVLTRDGHAAGHLLPGWLAGLLARVKTATREWAARSGVAPTWRRQTLLSIVSCALIFWARSSTPAEYQPWFLRLAGRALEEYQRLIRPGSSGPSQTEPQAGPPSEPQTASPSTAQDFTDWIAEFCALLPELRRRAVGTDLAVEVEALVAAAQSRTPGGDRFESLVQRLDNLHGQSMRVISGLGTGRPLMSAGYECPIDACARVALRDDEGHLPICHIPYARRMKLRRG